MCWCLLVDFPPFVVCLSVGYVDLPSMDLPFVDYICRCPFAAKAGILNKYLHRLLEMGDIMTPPFFCARPNCSNIASSLNQDCSLAKYQSEFCQPAWHSRRSLLAKLPSKQTLLQTPLQTLLQILLACNFLHNCCLLSSQTLMYCY